LARAIGPFFFASAWRIPGMFNPSKPRPPTLIMWRREKRVEWKPGQENVGFIKSESLSQDEFFGVEQAPGQVLEGEAAVLAFTEVGEGGPLFRFSGWAAERAPIKLGHSFGVGSAGRNQAADLVIR